MEIAVDVYAENPIANTKELANTSRFTFVALGKDHRAVDVPAVNPQTEEDKDLFAAAERRYMARKAARQASHPART